MTKKVQYRNDVFDRRIGKKVDANGDGTYESATYWVYDDAGKRDPNTGTALDDIVLEFTDADGDGAGASTLSSRYLHGPGIDQILASETISGNIVTWALADHQGTVRDMVRYSGGTTTVVNHRKYDAFGTVTAETDATVKFLFSYTGREWDGDASLYYYRARWYDAKVGRFVLEDPMGFAAGDANLNRYVGNSSPNGTDPSGMDETPTRDGNVIFSGDPKDIERVMGIWQRIRERAETNPELKKAVEAMTNAEYETRITVLNNSNSTWGGNYKNSTIDLADLKRFPENEDGPFTQQAEVLLHEVAEQAYKVGHNYKPYDKKEYDRSHAYALRIEGLYDGWERQVKEEHQILSVIAGQELRMLTWYYKNAKNVELEATTGIDSTGRVLSHGVVENEFYLRWKASQEQKKKGKTK